MTPDEIKSAIAGWCGYGSAVQLVEDRSEPGAQFVLGLRAAAAQNGGTVPLEARLEQDADRLTISSTAAGGGGDEVRKLLDSRPALVRSESSADGTSLRAHVYTDGLTRNSFMLAVEEVAKTRTLVDGLGGRNAASEHSDTAAAQPQTGHRDPWAADESSSTAQPGSSYGDAAGSQAPGYGTPSTLPQPSFGGQGAGSGYQPSGSQYQPSGSQSQAGSQYQPLSGQPAQPATASSAFAPTHTVPSQGMQAWAAPDPNGAVVATLGGHLPIQVTEVRGAWARIVCSNGWTGWVDGRIIGVAR